MTRRSPCPAWRQPRWPCRCRSGRRHRPSRPGRPGTRSPRRLRSPAKARLADRPEPRRTPLPVRCRRAGHGHCRSRMSVVSLRVLPRVTTRGGVSARSRVDACCRARAPQRAGHVAVERCWVGLSPSPPRHTRTARALPQVGMARRTEASAGDHPSGPATGRSSTCQACLRQAEPEAGIQWRGDIVQAWHPLVRKGLALIGFFGPPPIDPTALRRHVMVLDLWFLLWGLLLGTAVWHRRPLLASRRALLVRQPIGYRTPSGYRLPDTGHRPVSLRLSAFARSGPWSSASYPRSGSCSGPRLIRRVDGRRTAVRARCSSPWSH